MCTSGLLSIRNSMYNKEAAQDLIQKEMRILKFCMKSFVSKSYRKMIIKSFKRILKKNTETS